jgi:hypothetical protein
MKRGAGALAFWMGAHPLSIAAVGPRGVMFLSDPVKKYELFPPRALSALGQTNASVEPRLRDLPGYRMLYAPSECFSAPRDGWGLNTFLLYEIAVNQILRIRTS